MKIRLDFKSIRFRVWIYFLLLTIVILGLLWFLQTYLINNSYEKMKIKEVDSVVSQIYSAYERDDENLSVNISGLTAVSDYYVMMEYKGRFLLFSPDSETTAPVYKYRGQAPDMKLLVPSDSPEGSTATIRFTTNADDYFTIGAICLMDNTPDNEVYLYVFAPLYPVISTVNILKNQLFRVTLISLVIALILSVYLSRRISKPISKITDSARRMGTGDYTVKFDNKSSFSEINNLASTLNTAAFELGMADEKQKDLIANVSHDLKTPLTLIRSYAEMTKDLYGDDEEKRNNALQVIIDESDRMTNLVSDMSVLTKLHSSSLTINLIDFNLADALESVLSSYTIYEEQKGYTFNVSVPDSASVHGDPDRIKQVINNLLSNAVKYCGEDKEINVSIKRNNKKYRLEISDNGPGIKESELPHIWDRYYKTSSNFTRETSGTGLGLAIVKEILILHHADYGVISREGHGSTFWFEL